MAQMMFLLNEGGKSVFPFYEASHMYGVDGALPSRRNPTRDTVRPSPEQTMQALSGFEGRCATP